jgi:hypothetical protein
MAGMEVDEAIALYYDPKPTKRERNPAAFKMFHAAGHDCLSCDSTRGIHAHHLLSRAQGGDDVLANLVGLCSGCHGALHGTPCRTLGHRIDKSFVMDKIGSYLVREDGSDALQYLRSKRSDGWISAKWEIDL